MNPLQRLFPWLVVVLAIVYILLQARPPKETSPYHLQNLARVPVSSQGRVKPLDTVARNNLMILSDRQTFRINKKKQPAIRWLADLVTHPEQANQYKVFRIDHPGVLALMNLKQEDGKRFSFETITAHRETISQQIKLARQVKPKQRNPYQKHILQLSRQLNQYARLSRMQTPFWIPPLETGSQWQPFDQVYDQSKATGRVHPAMAGLSNIFSAYSHEQPDRFNQELAGYRQLLEQRLPSATRIADYEVFFNGFEPFYHTTILYVIAFLMACVSFLLQCMSPSGSTRWLGKATLWLLIVAVIVHTFGLASRVYLQGRPPVTNLYSSAVFIGWGCVLLALLMERIYRLGIGSITAAMIGFVTLIIAHNLAGNGDTMEMMQAVLDSNFWLATHVIAVTIGYSSTFLAGFLAILFILLGVLTPALKPDMKKKMGQMVYGVVCFALLFSFVGTILGGIWADQSWGRFWGWDPKENGAVLIVLMNALILHAWWAGIIRQRGLMVLAVCGNIVTSWSWFGTNMLGVGLHSYGFIDSAVFWLLMFVASQLAIIGMGLLPVRLWRSSKTP